MHRHAQNLLVHHRRAGELRQESAGFPSHALRHDQLHSLELLLTGALYPLTGYLGRDREDWQAYDACALLDQGLRVPDLLVDQGDADNFLAEQLKTGLLVEACERAGQKAEIRMQPGYDHSYYFISTFMAEHVAWHAERLKA